MRCGGVEVLTFGELTLLSNGTRNPPIAIAPTTTPITGISTINKIHLVAFAPVFRRSTLTWEIICAGRPRISSGTESELLQ